MAHPHDRGLFLPPASAAELAEREQLDHAQQVRTGRRLFFRWL
jgi:hypothetical protein